MTEMEYRRLPRTGDEVSVIGLGSSFRSGMGPEEVTRTVRMALDNGINYYDLAAAFATTFEAFGEAIKGRRDDILIQMHFGNEYSTGEYGRIYDLDVVRRNVAWQMEKVGTDYIDFGFIHCIDDLESFEKERRNGTIDLILKMREEGTVRHVGLSTHAPAVGMKAMELGLVDVIMFSINPAYDYQQGEWARGEVAERNEMYRMCQKEGVGISVMKLFSGGQMTDASISPFGQALTSAQCIQYALDKPGVVTVLPGVRHREDLADVLSYLDSTPEERDYSVVGTFAPPDAVGRCVYCNHCKPCPAGIDVGLVNKYYDLAMAGDSLARRHYGELDLKADDCVECGHCNETCPFKVDQVARMARIREDMGS